MKLLFVYIKIEDETNLVVWIIKSKKDQVERFFFHRPKTEF